MELLTPALHEVGDEALVTCIIEDLRVGLALIPKHSGERKIQPSAHTGVEEKSGAVGMISRFPAKVEFRAAASPAADSFGVDPFLP